MRKMKKMRLVMAIFVIAALIIPQSPAAAQFAGSYGKQQAEKSPGGLQKDTLKDRVKEGEIIFKSKVNASVEAEIIKKYGLSVIRRDRGLGYVLASVRKGDAQRVISALRKDKAIEYVQPNYLYTLLGRPNDPQYSRQWALPLIDAERGWSAARTGSPVIVAVLDTGVDVNHPDLKGRLVPGTNTVNPLKSSRDSEGHGTHVASIAGASTGNGIGVAGVAGVPAIKIMPVKVFDEWGGSDISISDGIIWAADHGARVINMSFGGFYQSEVLNEAIDYAYNKGVVLVAAAGNWASEEISYPAGLAKVIAVSATDEKDQLAGFSSYGPQIDVSAPGDGIYSAIWDPYKGSTYTELSGTSMASPMVAGLAGLLLAQNPKLSNEDVRQIIEVSATDLGDPGWDPEFGHGRINVYKAMTTSLKKHDDSDSTMDKAVPIQDGTAYREKINSGSDVDWFSINLPAKGNLQVEVLPAGKVTPAVEICDSAGAVLASLNTTDGVEDSYSPWDMPAVKSLKVSESVYGLIPNLEPGNYYIKVFGNHFRWSEEDYTISAGMVEDADMVKDSYEVNDSYDKAGLVSPGTDITGAIVTQDDEDWFKVSLGSGAYRIAVDVPEGLDLAVDIESSFNYKEINSDEDYWKYFDKYFSLTIDNAGQGQDEDGVIQVPQGGSGVYYLKVYEKGGNAVNASYTVQITGFKFRQDEYEANDALDKAASIELGEEVRANFHKPEEEDWYKIEVENTGILEINLKQPDNVWCEVELYRGDEGEPLGQGYNYGYGYGDHSFGGQNRNRSMQFKVSPGNYYLRIMSYDTLTAGDYSFDAQFIPFDFIDPEINDTPLAAIDITSAGTARGTLYPETDADIYVFEVTEPQTYLVYLTPPEDLNTVVAVAKEIEADPAEEEGGSDGGGGDDSDVPNGGQSDASGPPQEPDLEPLIEIDNGSQGQPDAGVFAATKPGKYYFAIAAVPGRLDEPDSVKSKGVYSLTIKPFSVTPDLWENNNSIGQARLIKINTPVKPTFMGTEDVDWFKVYVPGPGRLNVSLDLPEDIDGVVEVFDANGKFISRADLSMVGEEELVTVGVNKPGYYYVKAYDYLGNSSVQPYTLLARYIESIPPKVSEVKVQGNSVKFRLSEDCRVWVKVLNANASFVAMILDGEQYRAGQVAGVWNGRDAAGRQVQAGTYSVKIVAIDNSGNKSQPVYTSIKIK